MRVKLFLIVIQLILISLNHHTFSQLKSDTLTNKSIIELKKINLGNDLIKTKINNSFCQFDLSVDGLLFLKKSNIPDEIISEMFKKANQNNTLNTQSGTANSKTAIQEVPKSTLLVTSSNQYQTENIAARIDENLLIRYESLGMGVYYVSDDKKSYEVLSSIDEMLGSMFDNYGNLQTGPFHSLLNNFYLAGNESSVSLNNSSPTFFIVTHPDQKLRGSEISSAFRVYKGKTKLGRKFNLNKPTATSFPKKLNQNTLTVKFQNLAPGPYVLVIDSKTLANLNGRGLYLPKYYEFDIK